MLALATFLRFWQLDRVGFNSDEAVYSGTAAAIAGNDVMRGLFPIFRAHPLFLQILLSFGMHGGISDWSARAITAVIGVLAVGLTYLLGRRLYGHSAGLIAALLLAVMPYHVIVSRQVLLDGLMTLCATLVLYCVVRYVESGALSWMLASSAVMGAAVLSKETSIVMVAALYAFFALTPAVRVRLRHIGAGLLMLMLVVLAFPLALSMSGRASSGQHYLLWQLFRRSNHAADFYARVVPPAVGWATLAIALVSLVLLRRENTWRERLLLTWIVIPVLFFTLWPVKGYQYLLPAAPALALLAGRGLAHLPDVGWLRRRRLGPLVLVLTTLAVTVSLVVPTWQRIEPSNTGTYLAGTGGLPGGREAGALGAGQHPRARRAARGRAVDGQRDPVLRPAPGVRAVGQPGPGQPQPGLRPGAEPGSGGAAGPVPVPGLGLLHRQPVAAVRGQDHRAGQQVQRRAGVQLDHHGPLAGRPVGADPGGQDLPGAAA